MHLSMLMRSCVYAENCIVPVQAPEVFARNFGTQADMWSLGMLAYQTLSNRCVASRLPVAHAVALWLG